MFQRRKLGLMAAAATVALGAGVGSSQLVGADSQVSTTRDKWGRDTTTQIEENSAANMAAAAANSAHTLVVVSPFSNDFEFIDVNEDGESRGDYFIFHQDLRRPDTGVRVGEIQVECMLMFQTQAKCEGVLEFPTRGEFEVYGQPDGDDFYIAITGGTGEFVGAQGQMLVESKPQGERYTLRWHQPADG